ncbi:MAG: Hsp33 family molecular chaperone HslO, partial [Pseudomonadota bacterium]
DVCTCSRERLVGTLQGMADESLRDMVEPDGTLKVDCQFCSRQYIIPIEAFGIKFCRPRRLRRSPVIHSTAFYRPKSRGKRT